MTHRFGAAPEDWEHLVSLGLRSDLLPVVSNPNAKISPQSKMKALGKTPSRYNGHNCVAGITDWTSYEATDDDIRQWSEVPDYGICLQTRHVRAIDIDISDPELAQRIVEFTDLYFGEIALPLRYRSNSPKCLFAFKAVGEQRKSVVKLPQGIVEFLGDGQMFVGWGLHPSGVRYEWDWQGLDDFPTLTLGEVEAYRDALAKEFGASVETGAGARKNEAPIAIADPILEKLSVISWGRGGEANIECPFKAEHTMDSGETETRYFPAGTRGYEQGHFKCLHSHCEGKSDSDFMDALGITAGSADDFDVVEPDTETEKPSRRPEIKITGGGLSKETTKSQSALINADVPYYQRGPILVRPVTEIVDAARGRKTKTAQLIEVEGAHITDQLCNCATFRKFDKRSNEWVRINPPPYIALTLLARQGEWAFPKITGIITTPTLRPDGSLLNTPGYDAATHLLLVDPPELPPIAAQPSRSEALTAVGLLKGLLQEFPFIDDAGRSVALSALITPVVRGAFTVAPMHAVRAPSPGSGKSFLLDIASAIAIGQLCPVMAAGRNEEETEKRLSAALMSGQPIISIDNVNGDLGGDFLCQLIERPVVEVRVLGKSQMVKIESRSTVFATGNNLRLVGDTTRRVMLCMLDAWSERPELRQFKADPVDMVLKDRGAYIAACLTIIRAYMAAGQPDKLPKLASFEGWSDTVRSALVWLGEPDPVDTMERAREEDPYLQNMVNIFTAIKDCLGCKNPKSAADIVRFAVEGDNDDLNIAEDTKHKYQSLNDALIAAVGSVSGYLTSKEVGRWLGRHKGRIAAGLRLEYLPDKHGRGGMWWVEQYGRGDASDLV